MKIIKIVFLSVFAFVLIVSTGIFIFFETFDPDQYLTEITRKISHDVGRPVTIGHIGPGLSIRGITIDAGPLIIADDAEFTSQPFIKIDRVRICLDLKSLIFLREIHIRGILFQSPQIHFIRSKEGNVNAWSFARQVSSPVGSKDEDMGGVRKPILEKIQPAFGISEQSRARKDVIIKTIRIQDASISFIDQSQTMPLDIWLLNINASLNDVSNSNPIKFSFEASPLVSKGVSPGMPDSPVFKKVTGILQLNKVNLENIAGSDFRASGSITVTNGIIKNFNIIKTILSRSLGEFGSMQVKISNLINGPLNNKLGAEDTIIEKAELVFSSHDKSFFIDQSMIKTDILEFTAQGSLDQGLNTDLKTMLHLNADVSSALVNELEGLKFFYDDSNRITIGASLQGVIPHLKYKPDKDFRKKSKKMFIEEGGSILGLLLGGGQSASSADDSAKKPKSNFKNILKNFMQ